MDVHGGCCKRCLWMVLNEFSSHYSAEYCELYLYIQEFLSTAAVSVICGIAVYMYFNLVRCSTDLQQTGLKCLDMCHHPSDVDKGK